MAGDIRVDWGSIAVSMALIALTACGDNSSMNSSPSSTSSAMPAASASYVPASLTSDGRVAASQMDANLQNGWGIAFNPQGVAWVADNATSVLTLYDGNGVVQSLVVADPPGAAGSANPTGIVFNPTQSFAVSQSGMSAPSAFIVAGEAGSIAGWSPNVNQTTAIIVYDGAGSGTVYKGLAIASNGSSNFLYATDFHNKAVNIFDGNFTKLTTPGAFTDPSLPAGFAPFGIQAIDNKIYVTFAMQDAVGHDEINGAGLGVVDVFDTAGTFIKQLASGGPLNAPWGLAMAPSDFGPFSNDLLIGNFGDGKINAFDPNTGMFVGTLSTSDGTPIVIDGLWGIAFGNGLNNEPTNTLFFAAGPNGEADGLYGRIDFK